jgi:hypothetical protein
MTRMIGYLSVDGSPAGAAVDGIADQGKAAIERIVRAWRASTAATSLPEGAAVVAVAAGEFSLFDGSTRIS